MRLKSVALLVTLAFGLLAAPLAAEAQGRVYRIGFLGVPSRAVAPPFLEAFQQGMRELGWVEGQNFSIEHRWAEGEVDRLPALAAELVGLKVDVIVATTTPVALVAKKATTTIPIVMVLTTDPVQRGLVSSLARPGGNITGLSTQAEDLTTKYLEFLKVAIPNVSRMAVLWNPDNLANAIYKREIQAATPKLGMKILSVEARKANELDSAFAAMTKERVGGLVVLGDPMFFTYRARIADLAAKSRLPAIYGQREHVEAGEPISFC